jgi:chromosome segregation ATPase
LSNTLNTSSPKNNDEIASLKSQVSALQDERSHIITQMTIYEEQFKASELEKHRIDHKYTDKISEMQQEHKQEVAALMAKIDELTELLRAKRQDDDDASEVVVNPDGTVTRVLKPHAQSKSELIKLNALMEQ